MLYEAHITPEESYSRQLDQRVFREEMPYGYTHEPPPADTGNYNQRALESNKEYFDHGNQAV